MLPKIPKTKQEQAWQTEVGDPLLEYVQKIESFYELLNERFAQDGEIEQQKRALKMFIFNLFRECNDTI